MSAAQPAQDNIPLRRIVDPQQIGHFVGELVQHRSPLSITLLETAQTYTSYVLQCSSAQQRTVLDQLFPDDTERAVRGGTLLQIASRADQLQARFEAQVELCHQHPLGYLIQAYLPLVVHSRQRRLSFRTRIPDQARLSPSVLYSEQRRALRARLVDLSVGGLGAVVSSQEPLEAGEQLDCELNLPGHRIAARAQVRSVHPATSGQRLGINFRELGPRRSAMLEQVIASLQRQSLRQRASVRTAA